VVLIVRVFGAVADRLRQSPHAAGHVGYIKSRRCFGAGEFVGIQRGRPRPAGSGGRSVNIDVRKRTFTEEMLIPTRNRSS
jgi:hypothetical protein